MGLRNLADLRSLLWGLVLTPGMVALQYARPELAPYLFWVSCYFALSCGVMAHNHNHTPTFKSRALNDLWGNWLSLFYGYPTFAWIPTHNLNHHKYVNRPGDATITWRYTKNHTAAMAMVYFFVSSYWQAEPTSEFIKKAREKNPRLHRRIVGQYVLWVTNAFGMAALGVALHGWRTGLITFGLVTFLPSVFSLWTIMLFNYEQHVHADPWSKNNHSRSWTNPLLNFLLFNNGLHAAHHENAGAHWTELPAIHARIAPHIDPRLIENGWWWYVIKQYLLAPVFPRFGTVQVGRPAWDPPDGKADLATGAVDAVDAGTNAVMLPGA